MVIPTKYVTGTGIVPVYDNQQSFGAQAYMTLYGLVTKDGSATAYKLVPQQDSYSYAYKKYNSGSWNQYLEFIETFIASTQNLPPNKEFDKTFESQNMNANVLVEGDALVTIPTVIQVTPSGTTMNYYYVVEFFADTTSLGSITLDTLDYNGGGDYYPTNITFNVPLSGVVKIGQKIKMNLQVWLCTVGGGSAAVVIGHDPAGRDGLSMIPSTNNYYTTQLKVNIPVRILE